MTEKQMVTERAILQRIKRKLATEGQFVQHGEKNNPGLGYYWVCDSHSGNREWGFDDVEETARDLGCLQSFEAVETETVSA